MRRADQLWLVPVHRLFTLSDTLSVLTKRHTMRYNTQRRTQYTTHYEGGRGCGNCTAWFLRRFVSEDF